jgi:hypothetical protein
MACHNIFFVPEDFLYHKKVHHWHRAGFWVEFPSVQIGLPGIPSLIRFDRLQPDVRQDIFQELI